jgi:hypothetical protein
MPHGRGDMLDNFSQRDRGRSPRISPPRGSKSGSARMTNADAPTPPPFPVGTLVRIKNRLDRCIHRVAEIEWRISRCGTCAPYWSIIATPHAADAGETLPDEPWIGQAHMLDPVEG